jgi:hypothetical protein
MFPLCYQEFIEVGPANAELVPNYVTNFSDRCALSTVKFALLHNDDAFDT